MQPHSLDILAVHRGSPAARAGLKIGDKIINVDGHETSKDPAKVAKRLSGPIGEKVNIVVRRPSTWDLFNLTLVREAVEVPDG